MKWFYAASGRQQGPVEDDQLPALIAAGILTPETLVWREGMADWQPWGQVRPVGFETDIPAPPVVPCSGPGGIPPEAAACAECGRVEAKADMMPYQGFFVCAGCKPRFLQKLAEGAPLRPGVLEFAGFWVRFGAKFIDWTILGIFLFPPLIYLVVRHAQNVGDPEQFGWFQVVQLGFQLAYILAGMVYNVFFIGKFGATPGKMLFRLRVVTAEAGRVSYARATGRYFAELISGMVCYIGYLVAALDDQKRALHDHICNTRVVVKT